MTREPRVIEMCQSGDKRRFLCLMEGEPGQVTAGTFELTYREVNDPVRWARELEGAWRRAAERAEAGKWLETGKEWEDYR